MFCALEHLPCIAAEGRENRALFGQKQGPKAGNRMPVHFPGCPFFCWGEPMHMHVPQLAFPLNGPEKRFGDGGGDHAVTRHQAFLHIKGSFPLVCREVKW